MLFENDFYFPEVREGFYIPAMMKKCWAAQLEVLSDVDKVCQKYNIEYFAEWGTLLGAIRHGGFIPWDDDMDICMKRVDYERFLNVIEEEFKDKYIIENFHTTDNRNNFLTRISNTNQFRFDNDFMEKYHEFPFPAGIDVFQLDYVPAVEKASKFRDQMRYLITVAENENAPEVNKNNYDRAIEKVEKEYNVKIDRSKPAMSQIYRIADDLCASFPENETDYITLMPVWLVGNGNYKIPKELYSQSIRIPYENMTIPVPIGYDEILRIKYNNYMKPVRDWDSHEYPYFKQHEEILKNKHDIEFSKYYYNPLDLQRIMPNSVIHSLLSVVYLMKEAHQEIYKNMITDYNGETINELLADCQDAAINIGNTIEEVLGEGSNVIVLLEDYCEKLFLLGNETDLKGLENLDLLLENIEQAIKDNVPKYMGTSLSGMEDLLNSSQNESEKKKVFLIVSRADEWKYIKKEYEKYANDENYDVYVMPIPFFIKSIIKGYVEKKYEFDLFNKSLPLINYETIDLAAIHPEIIVIQNAYDDANIAYTIDPNYYSSLLKNYTDKLIYIPPFITDDFSQEDGRCREMMNEYVAVPGVVHSDEIIVQSNSIKERYIECLVEMAGEETFTIWNQKLVVESNSKLNDKELLEYPKKWDIKLRKETGEYKKILFINISKATLLMKVSKGKKKIDLMMNHLFNYRKQVLSFIKIESNINDVNLEEKNQIDKYINGLKDKDWLIVVEDDKDIKCAVEMTDAFYGDSCVETTKIYKQGKPVMIQRYDI